MVIAKSLKVENGYPHRIHRKKRKKHFGSQTSRKLAVRIKKIKEEIKEIYGLD